MWNYEKRLQYPICIKTPNPKMALAILSQYGGPDGEMGASMRYLSQRYTMPNRRAMGTLSDIGSEAPEMFQNEKSTDKPDNLKGAEKPYIIEVGEVERTINLCVAIPVKFEYVA